jgi:hypothetical protein
VAAQTLASVGLGALIAGIPLLSSTSAWDKWVVPVYVACVGVTFVIAALCGLAARSALRERADSVEAVKSDLDGLLDAYEEPTVSTDVERGVLRHFLIRMRTEARESWTLFRDSRQSSRKQWNKVL